MARYPSISWRGAWSIDFWGLGHGKEERDGIGAVVRQWVQHYQLDKNGMRFENVVDVVELLQQTYQIGVYSTFGRSMNTKVLSGKSFTWFFLEM